MNDKQTIQFMLDALKVATQLHYYCEDRWYSCPKHEDGCANDAYGDECNCGADKVNADIDKAIVAGNVALAQPEQETGNILMDSYNAMQAKKVAAQPEQDIADILAGELQISRATAYDLMREALALAQPEPPPANILKVQALMRLMVRKFRNACSTTDYDQVYKELQRAAHEVLMQPEQVKPWVGLTDEENHIAEVLNKTLGLQYVADKLQEKNT